jgi:Cupredoxin-like domain
MQDTMHPDVYRVTLSSSVCRSGFALLHLNIAEVKHVSAVTATSDNTLVVVASDGADIYDELVAAVVDSGFDPMVVTVAELERLVDPTDLSVEQAIQLGPIEPAKQPIRAATVQRVAVHVTDGYDPDTILVSAGVPTEFVFSEGHGCLGRVVFESLGIEADLEDGGALVELPALQAGTYPFRCGRDMVHGTLIVE